MTTLWFDKALLADGWARSVRIVTRDGRIAGIEAGSAARPDDERHAIAIPGVGNLHSHAFQRAMAGLTEKRGATADSFWSWRELMYRFTERLTPVDQQAIAALAYMEMLEAGFTRVGEFHYLHHDIGGTPFADRAEMGAALCQAAADTGIGLTLLPVFYAHSGFGGMAPNDGQARFINGVDGFARLLDDSRAHIARLDDGRLGIAPHSLRAVTADELRQIVLLSEGPIHIHIAEQVREVEDCLAHSGQPPVEWLLDHVDVGPRWCLVHATHMTAAETARLAKSGAVAGLCPITEANLGDGVFPADVYLAAGGRMGVGSDSNVLISLAEELRLLEYSQRLTRQSRNVLAGAGQSTGARLFDEAVKGGAQALGAKDGLRLGAFADIVSLDGDHPALIGKDGDAILDGLVFAAARAPVDCVWRFGRKCIEGGRHVARDAIVAAYGRTLAGLLA